MAYDTVTITVDFRDTKKYQLDITKHNNLDIKIELDNNVVLRFDDKYLKKIRDRLNKLF